METSNFFKKYHPWKISDFQLKYRPDESPNLNTVLVIRQYPYTNDFKYAKHYGVKKEYLRVVSSGGRYFSYTNHTVMLPDKYNYEKIHHTQNDGCDHVFFLEPIRDETQVISSIERFIKNVSSDWYINEYENNKREFLEMINKLSDETKEIILGKIYEYYNEKV